MTDQFWEHTVSTAIWAVVIVAVVFILRVRLGEMLLRLTSFKFKHGETELSFEQGVKRNRPKVKAIEELKVVDPRDFEQPQPRTPNELPTPDPVPLEYEKPARSYERLDEFVGQPRDSVRPSLVVEISWRAVMEELRQFLVSKGKLSDMDRPSVETMLASVIGNQLLPSLVVDSISGLYGTKLQVSGTPYFEPEWEATKEYESQSQKLIRAIRRYQ